MVRVVALHSYLIKGCARTSPAETAVTSAGLRHDRAFMVVDKEGTFRSQRRDPRLALIRPDIDGDHLTLAADGVEPVRLTVDTTSARRPVTLFGDPFLGIGQGELAAGWLSEVLGKRSRLVRVPPEHDRVTDGLTPGTSGYADSSAVHLLSVSSLEELNDRIVRREGRPVPMSLFRPNIVVDGWTEPHTEDLARRCVAGDVELGYTKLAIRCAVALVDQDAAAKAGPEPLRTLASYRRAAGGGTAFGVKFAVVRAGKLSIGDEVTVTEWGGSGLTG